MQKFYQFKDPQYGTLLNLLNNYIPLLLSIYSISFKLNHFSEYFRAIIGIWIMFTCLQRRHYNKAPLVWIDMCLHWGNYCFLTISFNFLKLNVPKYSRIWYKKNCTGPARVFFFYVQRLENWLCNISHHVFQHTNQDHHSAS